MKKIVKIAVVGLIAAAVGADALYTAYAPLPVRLHTVEAKEAHVFFTESGVVAGGTEIQVYPGVTGDILDVPVKIGQYVKKGDALLSVDPAAYMDERAARHASIRSIEANMESAVAEENVKKDGFRDAIAELLTQLDTIEAQRVSARAESLYTDTAADRIRLLELSISQAELDRDFWLDRLGDAEALFESGAATRLEVSDAEKRVADIDKQIEQYGEQIAAARSESGKASSRSSQVTASADGYYEALSAAARAQIGTLEKNLAKDYARPTLDYYQTLIDAERERAAVIEANIAKCSVTAPADGRIVGLAAANMTSLPPQGCAAVIRTATEGTRVESYVSTRDAPQIAAGDIVSVTLRGRGGDRVFEGAVDEIQEWAETRLSALGIEEKRVKLFVDTADPEGILKPGYEVDVRYDVYREADRLTVPNGAIFEIDGADYVFVLEDGAAAARPVTAGVKTTVETVIESGLSAGETVVAEANTEGLEPGKRIAAAG